MARPRGVKEKLPRLTGANKQAILYAAKCGVGKTPLDIMLEDMKTKYEQGDLEGAADRAETCAPYVHARLASTTVTHRDAIDDLSVDQLRALLAIAEHSARSPGGTLTIEARPEAEGEQDSELSAIPEADEVPQ